MRSIGIAVITCLVMGSTTAAMADAVVSPVSGSILVSQGQGFVRQAKSVSLKNGDRVMVSEGNRGKITYGDGCAVDLLPGSVQIVRDQSPCAYKAQFGDQRRDSFFGTNVAGLAVAGGVVALGVTAAVISTNEKDASSPTFVQPMSP